MTSRRRTVEELRALTERPPGPREKFRRAHPDVDVSNVIDIHVNADRFRITRGTGQRETYPRRDEA